MSLNAQPPEELVCEVSRRLAIAHAVCFPTMNFEKSRITARGVKHLRAQDNLVSFDIDRKMDCALLQTLPRRSARAGSAEIASTW